MLVDFYLILLNLTQNSLPETYLQIQAAPQIKVAICFFYGAPCIHHFYRVRCSKSILLCRICGEQNLSFFHHLWYSDSKNLYLTMLRIPEAHSRPGETSKLEPLECYLTA